MKTSQEPKLSSGRDYDERMNQKLESSKLVIRGLKQNLSRKKLHIDDAETGKQKKNIEKELIRRSLMDASQFPVIFVWTLTGTVPPTLCVKSGKLIVEASASAHLSGSYSLLLLQVLLGSQSIIFLPKEIISLN